MPAGDQKYLKKEIDKLKGKNLALREKLSSLRKEKLSIENELENIRKIFRNLPGCLVLIEDQKVSLINSECLKKFGYSEDEIMRRNFSDFVHPDYLDVVMTYHRRRLSGKYAPERYETFLTSKNGAPVCCEVLVNKIRHHRRTAVLVNIVDLENTKKNLAESLLTHKSEALNLMAEGLSKKLGRFLGILDQHIEEINGTGAFTDYGTLKSFKTVRSAKDEGEKFLNDLRILSKVEKTSDSSSFDLAKAVEEALESAKQNMEPESAKNGIKIKLKRHLRNLPRVMGDHDEMRDAITRIISNAFDALPDGGEIHLTTEEHSGFAKIFVQDNGVGISDVIKEKIFDPFFSTDEDKRTGLGLSLAKATVKAQGGNIEVISQKGQGSTFIINLPLAGGKKTKKKRSSLSGINKSKIQMIIGEGVLGDILVQILESRGGKVAKTSSVTETIKAFKKKNIDIFIIDYGLLPSESPDIIKMARKWIPKALVIMINTPMNRDVSSRPDIPGVDMSFSKPIEANKVVLKLSEHLEKRGA